MYKLEACVDNVTAAVAAAKAGAHRLELCAALELGGLTPSIGLLTACREVCDLPIHVLIRPRAGDFLYSETEVEAMIADIKLVREAGAQGIVTGLLMADGQIDLRRMEKLIAAAGPLPVTFHRAFDMCSAPLEALEKLITLGVTTLLSSGQESSADKGAALLAECVTLAAGRIEIMPGGGITPENIEQIATQTGAKTFHCSAVQKIEGNMEFRNPRAFMGKQSHKEEYLRPVGNPAKIRAILATLDAKLTKAF